MIPPKINASSKKHQVKDNCIFFFNKPLWQTSPITNHLHCVCKMLLYSGTVDPDSQPHFYNIKHHLLQTDRQTDPWTDKQNQPTKHTCKPPESPIPIPKNVPPTLLLTLPPLPPQHPRMPLPLPNPRFRKMVRPRPRLPRSRRPPRPLRRLIPALGRSARVQHS